MVKDNGTTEPKKRKGLFGGRKSAAQHVNAAAPELPPIVPEPEAPAVEATIVEATVVEAPVAETATVVYAFGAKASVTLH